MKCAQFLLTVALAGAMAVPGSAQDYVARDALPSGGSEVVLVFLSDAYCTGNAEERLDDVIREAKSVLRSRVESRGDAFFAVGAAVQWGITEGLDYLLRGVSLGYSDKDFGAWDEIWVGRHWLNNAAIQHIWRGDLRSTIPQLVVFRRDVVVGQTGIEVGDPKVLARIVGSRQIIDWFDQGLPFDR